MTYAEFLILFLVVPLACLALLLRRRLLNRRFLALALALMGVAFVFMAPWDHTAAVWGLWTWAPGHTWGLRIWAIPPEEYLFCLLEALLAVVVTFTLLTGRRGSATSPTMPDAPAERKGKA